VDFYEVGMYLLIIIVASGCVFGIMFLLMRSMRPKRPKRRRSVNGQIKSAPIKRVAEEKEDKKDKDKKKDKSKKNRKSKKDELLELKDLPANKLLPEGVAGESNSKNKSKTLAETNEDEKSQVAQQENGQENNKEEEKPAEYQELSITDLPAMDTLVDGEEDAPEKEELDLMSVFETEDAEDSSTSDLAANLFDVDVQNIEKLGSEVSEYLNGMRSR
jgi:hypothetical protein